MVLVRVLRRISTLSLNGERMSHLVGLRLTHAITNLRERAGGRKTAAGP
ncbi:hypothetical protein [Fodinibius sp.]